MKRAFLPFALILVGSIGLTHTFTKLNAQDTTAPAAHSTLRLRTPNGWVELSAPTGAGFVVDGGSVQVEGMSNEPMSLERTADGFSLVCNGWTYTTAGAFTMSKDGKALVVGRRQRVRWHNRRDRRHHRRRTPRQPDQGCGRDAGC